MPLTEKDIELARRYVICRSAIKAFNKDKEYITEADLELRNSYLNLIVNALVKANNELRELNKYPISVKVTDQPTVYEVKIGNNRQGYIEVNVVEITEEIAKRFLGLL
jgi:hypothetical protein